MFATANQIIRTKGIVSLLSHIELVTKRRLHYWLWDRRYEADERVSTHGYVTEENLDPVGGASTAGSRGYLPTPRLVIKWILEGLNKDYSKYSFVDFGSGRGRVLMSASEYDFRSVLGIEFSQDLHQQAVENIENYPTRNQKCRDIRSICVDAATYELPDEDMIAYFFNPFWEELMEKVVSNIVATSRNRKNRLLIMYYNPVHDEV